MDAPTTFLTATIRPFITATLATPEATTSIVDGILVKGGYNTHAVGFAIGLGALVAAFIVGGLGFYWMSKNQRKLDELRRASAQSRVDSVLQRNPHAGTPWENPA
ncbi:hypothetical protein ACJ41O_010628 [Fusarium nematophilum]